MRHEILLSVGLAVALASCVPSQAANQSVEKGLIKQPMPMPVLRKGEEWELTLNSFSSINRKFVGKITLGQPQQREDQVSFTSRDIDFNGGVTFDLKNNNILFLYVDNDQRRIFLCGFSYLEGLNSKKSIIGKQASFSFSDLKNTVESNHFNMLKESKVDCAVKLLIPSQEKEFYVFKETVPRKNPNPDQLVGEQKDNLPKKGEVWESEGRNPKTGEVRRISLTLNNVNFGNEQFIVNDVMYGKTDVNWKSMLYDSYLGVASLQESRYFGERIDITTRCYVKNYKNIVGLRQQGYYFVDEYEVYRKAVDENNFSNTGECWIERRR